MLRRRTTDRSVTDREKEKEKEKEKVASKRPSGVHDLVPEDDTSGLGLELEMELQRQGKDGGQWGIAEDARMNLE